MATNRKYANGRKLRLAVDSDVVSGDPCLIGTMTAVALTDYDAADGKATVDFGGVWDVSVKGVDDAGNSAVAVGDKVFFVNADTPELSKKSSGYFFGYALEAVSSGATSTIMVKQIDGAGPGSSDIVSLTIATADLADDAVTAAKIAADAVGSSEIAAGAVTASEVAADAVGWSELAAFVSTEQTGTGSAQNVPHGMSSAPSAVIIAVTEHPGTPDTGAFDVAEGSHDATNVVVTVTADVKFKVISFHTGT